MGSLPRRPAFPSTRWSRILLPGGGRDLDALARTYGNAIVAFLRARLRCGEHDAADVAQDAFAWMLQSGLLDKADPARGRFRGFLKTALANFAIEHGRKQRALKRGGDHQHASLDVVDDVVDPGSKTPAEALDLAWRRELLERAHAALRSELAGGGRAKYWQLFHDYFLADPQADGEQPTHALLAERHAITRADVSNWLDHGKRRYRAILRDLVAETVASPEELELELAWLFGAARRSPAEGER